MLNKFLLDNFMINHWLKNSYHSCQIIHHTTLRVGGQWWCTWMRNMLWI